MILKNGERLTKKVAKRITIEEWVFLAETGKEKWEWDGWQKYGKMLMNCPLCELYEGCEREGCPLNGKLGICGCYNYAFKKWEYAKTVRTRKKYAKLFLEQLRRL